MSGSAWRSVAAGLAVLAGRASIGPATVPADRVDYADALASSWKAQMLLNIVRLCYADVPTFMDVASIVSAYALQGQVQAGVAANFGVPSATLITPGVVLGLIVEDVERIALKGTRPWLLRGCCGSHPPVGRSPKTLFSMVSPVGLEPTTH